MRGNREQYLWIIVKAVVIVEYFRIEVRFEVKLGVDALRVGVYLGVPTEGN